MPQQQQLQPIEEVDTDLKKKCPKCGHFFSTKGGGITRHMAKCQGDGKNFFLKTFAIKKEIGIGQPIHRVIIGILMYMYDCES